LDSTVEKSIKINTMFKPYTPDRAYRWSVLPLGILSILGGIFFFAGAMLMPPEFVQIPPFVDIWLKRLAMGFLCFYLVLIGIGLCYRNKAAWLGFFAYIIIGTIWHIAVGICDPQYAIFVIMSPLFNVPFAISIYFATKPVFVH
jgi:hypothetical protein